MNKLIIDCATGEHKEVPLTQEELDEIERSRRESEEQRERDRIIAEAAEAAKISARSKLYALGLTEEEISAIIA